MPSSAPRWRPCWKEATWGANDGRPCWESITHNHGPKSLSSKASVPSCFRRNTWHTLTYRIIPPKPNKGHNHLRPTKGSLDLFALLNALIVSDTCRAQTHKPHTFWSLPCMLSATTSWYNKRSVISHFLRYADSRVVLVSLHARTKCESSSSAIACAVGALSQNKLYKGSSLTKALSSVVGLYSHELSLQSGCVCHTFCIRPLQVLVVMSHTIFDKETRSWICTYFFLIHGRISVHLAHLRTIASQVSHNQSGAKVAHFLYVDATLCPWSPNQWRWCHSESLILINCKSLQRFVQPPWNSKQAWTLWICCKCCGDMGKDLLDSFGGSPGKDGFERNKNSLNEFMCYLIHLVTIQNSIENTFGLTPVKIPHLSIKLSWGSLDELLQGFPLTKPTCIFKASKWIPGIQHAKCLHCHMNVPCFRCSTVSVLFLFAFLPPSLATSSW